MSPSASTTSPALPPTTETDAIEGEVDRVLTQDLYWFPVRHHSPMAARHVAAAIAERRPKVVFIEGPPNANHLVPHIVDRKTRPPIAIYSSYRDDDNVLGLAGIASPSEDVPARFASWYPLLEYSPEYVAMGAAGKVKAEVRFIDLANHARLQPRSITDVGDPGAESEPAPDDDGHQRIDEPVLTEHQLYDGLARAAGFADWDDAWESLFEFGDNMVDREYFRRELATFCAAARLTATAERLELDGNLARERAMRANIAAGLAEVGCEPADGLVVCGGFHLFMDHDDEAGPPSEPPGTVYTSVVPYSYFQTSQLSGYGAGNRAPRFYQAVWEQRHEDANDRLLANHAVTTLAAARKRGAPASSADAIAVAQHTRMLAALRGRARPILTDLHDAIITCCCKGDPDEEGRPYRQAMDEVDIGNRIGRVTPALGRLPLVRDFYQCLTEAGMDDVIERELAVKHDLDKRDPVDRDVSALLHRFRYLEVPLATVRSTGSLESGTLFKEQWSLKWSPKVEAALIEKNMFGDTIETAAAAVLADRLATASASAAATCRELRAAVELALPDMIGHTEQACRHAIEADTRFASLGQALGELDWLHRYALYSDIRQDQVWTLIEAAHLRACFALPGAASVPDEEHQAVVQALRTVADLDLRDTDGRLDRALFVDQVRSAETQSTSPYLKGALLGMLAEMRAIAPSESAVRVAAYAQEPPERLVDAGDFLHGLLSVSPTSLLVGSDDLVAAVDQLLVAADWEVFLVMLPRMRLAFSQLHERQRRSLAERVAVAYGLVDGGDQLAKLDTSVGTAVLFARIDAATAELMQDWGF